MKKTRSVIIFVTLCILGLIAFGFSFYDAALDFLETVFPSKTSTVHTDSESSFVDAGLSAPAAASAPVRTMPKLPSWCMDVSELNGDFYSAVQNDSTGLIREYRIYTDADFSRYALSYYYAYISSDDEIHYIVNASGDFDTWRLRVEDGAILIDRYEAVPGEDQDGSRLGSGAFLASYEIGLSDWTARQLSGERYVEATPQVEEAEKHQYVGNSRSKVFHLASCPHVSEMSEENKVPMYTTREDMIAQGYKPCGSCNP